VVPTGLQKPGVFLRVYPPVIKHGLLEYSPFIVVENFPLKPAFMGDLPASHL
jgi:hypothetical protein